MARSQADLELRLRDAVAVCDVLTPVLRQMSSKGSKVRARLELVLTHLYNDCEFTVNLGRQQLVLLEIHKPVAALSILTVWLCLDLAGHCVGDL